MDDSATMADEVIKSYYKEAKTVPKNFNEKKGICKIQNFYVLFTLLLIIIALLIVIIKVSLYVTIKDSKYVKIYSVNPLYLIFNKGNEYFEETNRNEYLTLVPSNDSKEKIKKNKICGVKLWSEI